MALGHQGELQKAVLERLSGDAAMITLVGDRIYDDVPEGATFPYLAIGDSNAASWAIKDSHGEEIRHTVHVWSRSGGRKEALEILEAVRVALSSSSLTLAVGELVTIDFNFSEVFTDADGETRHGVLRLKALVHS